MLMLINNYQFIKHSLNLTFNTQLRAIKSKMSL